MTVVHVHPIGDLIEHDTGTLGDERAMNDDCVCGPTVEFVDGGVMVVHHSLDSRERYE